MFITINGIMLNITDVQMGRLTDGKEAGAGGSEGCKVYFISGGYTIIPGVTAEELAPRFNELWIETQKALAPF